VDVASRTHLSAAITSIGVHYHGNDGLTECADADIRVCEGSGDCVG